MKITLQSTEKVVTLNGLPARIWEGKTESGIEVHAYITLIAVEKTNDTSEFERELQEQKPPTAAVESIPLNMII